MQEEEFKSFYNFYLKGTIIWLSFRFVFIFIRVIKIQKCVLNGNKLIMLIFLGYSFIRIRIYSRLLNMDIVINYRYYY